MHYNDTIKQKRSKGRKNKNFYLLNLTETMIHKQWYNKTKALQMEEEQKLLSTKPNWDYDT